MTARKFYPAVAGWLVAVALVNAPARADSADKAEPAASSANDGQQIYQRICQGCHMPNGQGAVGAGYYPAFANNRTLVSRQYMALTILAGRRNMPAFGAKHALGFFSAPASLSDAQIAAVINYIRTHFGNRYKDPITAAEVARLDQSLH
jgi:mono/diheme cytochrome c family protein